MAELSVVQSTKTKIKRHKKNITVGDAVRQFNLLQMQTTDDLMGHVFMRNIKSLKPYVEKFQDDRLEKQLNFAYEDGGVLVKDEKGHFKFSKENSILLEKEIKKLEDEIITVEFFMMKPNDAAKKLASAIRNELLGTIFLDENEDKFEIVEDFPVEEEKKETEVNAELKANERQD